MELRAEIYALKAEFMKRATLERIDRERLSEEMRKRIARERKEEIEDRRNAEFVMAVMATPVQLQEFTVKLDRYDTATVEALMENGEKLQEVRKQLDQMLLEAHVLPDGRRVFRTRDGKQVFDEVGKEVGADVIRADAIHPGKPSWELYHANRGREATLQEERTHLQDYQQKLDDARVTVKEGGLTKEDLDQLDADLEKSMPKTVRDIVQRNEAQRAEIDKASLPQATDTAPERPLSMERRAALAPSQLGGMG
jgi:hypothetical protein